jgi:hypothetical protein
LNRQLDLRTAVVQRDNRHAPRAVCWMRSSATMPASTTGTPRALPVRRRSLCRH